MTTSSFTAISSLGFCALDCSIADGQADSLTDGPTERMSDCWQTACLPARVTTIADFCCAFQ